MSRRTVNVWCASAVLGLRSVGACRAFVVRALPLLLLSDGGGGGAHVDLLLLLFGLCAFLLCYFACFLEDLHSCVLFCSLAQASRVCALLTASTIRQW